ncbi:hypothetical protein RHMOL_Rhmol01G0187800 [Rhododendron molle]|uniref:Uncharacterized protein n=1 Tax=Rhododendron molle TaxID=49168 RepID=A0ACC0Q4H0_RHOML|nr:hypothetical protein RHMOL_Rhmol01G0187800 [Rhododendron molle]
MLDISKRKTWEDIEAAFIAQYNYNSQLKMTIRELESTKMEPKESFADFVKRWRAKAALMTECPSERDQLRIISRTLHLHYAKHLVPVQASANFKTFFEPGLAIEDALQTGVLPRGESSSSSTQKAKPRAYLGDSSSLFVLSLLYLANPEGFYDMHYSASKYFAGFYINCVDLGNEGIDFDGIIPRKCVPSPKRKIKGMLSLLKEEIVSINLKDKDNIRMVQIRSNLPPEEHCARSDRLEEFIKRLGVISQRHAWR